MENYNNNYLQDWIDSDAPLRKLLATIDEEETTDIEKARKAFYALADLYNLPKFPDDIEDREEIMVKADHFYEPVSMYEVLAKVKFAEKNLLNIKSNVLTAAYLIINYAEPLIDDELEEYLNEEELEGFGYKGEDVGVELIPIKYGENFNDLGCTYFIKEV